MKIWDWLLFDKRKGEHTWCKTKLFFFSFLNIHARPTTLFKLLPIIVDILHFGEKQTFPEKVVFYFPEVDVR